MKKITIVLVLCVIVVSLSSCKLTQINYYSQKDNYISVTGTADFINDNDEFKAMYLGFSDLVPTLDDDCFKIVGKNLDIVKANKINEKLEIGDSVTFITAPRYFGDGYVMPIVSITVNGETLLEFEEGYNNLLEWLSEN